MASNSYDGPPLDMRYKHITERDTDGETVAGTTSDDKGTVSTANVPFVPFVDLRGAIEEQDSREYACPECGARFDREPQRDGHRATHSKSPDRRIEERTERHAQRTLNAVQLRFGRDGW